MDRLDAMRVLLAVVDAGSLSAGSRRLDVPLATVSRKVSELERELGVRLLIRTSRSVQLTDAGRDYVGAVRDIIVQLDEAERRALGEYERPRGQLTLATPSEFGRLVGAPLAYEFLEQHPDISLDILILERHVDLVEERVDVGVRLGPLADSSLYAVKVGDLAISTCASPAYLARKGLPLHPADLADHDAILYRYPATSAWTYLVDGASFETQPRFRVRANAASTCRDAAVRGLGVVRLFDFQVEQELGSGALVRILETYETASTPAHLVYVKQGVLPLKLRVFLDWMTPRLRERLK
jgi:DNA-binding transcriptional LysR family regulator